MPPVVPLPPNIPGTSYTYTLVVKNNGPTDVKGAKVTDNFPATVTNISWTAVGTTGTSFNASGTGNISESVDVPAGGTITYTVNTTILSSATGKLTDTATVATPSGIIDLNSSNNTNTDIDDLNPVADLQASATNDVTVDQLPQVPVTFTYTVANNGPSDASSVAANITLPQFTTVSQVSGDGSYNSTTAVWTIGKIAASSSAQLAIKVIPSATTTYTSTIIAQDAALDPNSINNQASSSFKIDNG